MTRSTRASDRRHVEVTLTDVGLSAVTEAIAAQAEREQAWLDTLSSDERATLAKLVARLVEQPRPERSAVECRAERSGPMTYSGPIFDCDSHIVESYENITCHQPEAFKKKYNLERRLTPEGKYPWFLQGRKLDILEDATPVRATSSRSRAP